jgi:hypothetical protein
MNTNENYSPFGAVIYSSTRSQPVADRVQSVVTRPATKEYSHGGLRVVNVEEAANGGQSDKSRGAVVIAHIECNRGGCAERASGT